MTVRNQNLIHEEFVSKLNLDRECLLPFSSERGKEVGRMECMAVIKIIYTKQYS
jgi:hypothetical protein